MNETEKNDETMANDCITVFVGNYGSDDVLTGISGG